MFVIPAQSLKFVPLNLCLNKSLGTMVYACDPSTVEVVTGAC